MDVALSARAARVNLAGMQTMGGTPKAVQLIRADMTVLGDGSDGNPFRRSFELYTLEGALIVAVDPLDPTIAAEAKRKATAQRLAESVDRLGEAHDKLQEKLATSKPPNIPSNEELSKDIPSGEGVAVEIRLQFEGSSVSDQRLFRIAQMSDATLQFEAGEAQAIAKELLTLRSSLQDAASITFQAGGAPDAPSTIIRRVPPSPLNPPHPTGAMLRPGRQGAAPAARGVQTTPGGATPVKTPNPAVPSPVRPAVNPAAGIGGGANEPDPAANAANEVEPNPIPKNW